MNPSTSEKVVSAVPDSTVKLDKYYHDDTSSSGDGESDDGESYCSKYPHSDPEFTDSESYTPRKIRFFCKVANYGSSRSRTHWCSIGNKCIVWQWTMGFGPLRRRYGFSLLPKYAKRRNKRCLGRHVKQKEPYWSSDDSSDSESSDSGFN